MALNTSFEPEPTAVFSYHSQGRVAVIGDQANALAAAERLAANGLQCALVTAANCIDSSAAGTTGISVLQAKASRLSGYLGRFELTLAGSDKEQPLATLLGPDWGQLDLVLDLGEQALLSSALTPPGYAHPKPDAVDNAIAELSELIGEFDKPRFFDLDPSRCAHSRSGIQACTRCLDACPTDAIRSAGDSIEVDPGLCQGAGVCATACPSGAISYAYPARRDTLQACAELLSAYAEAGGHTPVLLFHDAEQGREVIDQVAVGLPERVLPLEVAEIGSVGLETWLNVVARGGAVALLMPEVLPQSVRSMLSEQLGHATRILKGLGYDPQSVAMLDAGQLLSDPGSPGRIPNANIPPARHAALNDKRSAALMAIDHLYQYSPGRRPMVTLEVGSPFGEVTVEQQRCTLCMACVSQCPGKALIAGGDVPALRFVEQNCIQCGMCSRTCPEDAIAPSPRLLFDANARRKERTLKQDEPFLCIACAKPFATRSMITRIKAQIGSHPMFAGGGLRRLEMCDNCRVIDMHQPVSDTKPQASEVES